jgi:hypothetical protein
MVYRHRAVLRERNDGGDPGRERGQRMAVHNAMSRQYALTSTAHYDERNPHRQPGPPHFVLNRFSFFYPFPTRGGKLFFMIDSVQKKLILMSSVQKDETKTEKKNVFKMRQCNPIVIVDKNIFHVSVRLSPPTPTPPPPSPSRTARILMQVVDVWLDRIDAFHSIVTIQATSTAIDATSTSVCASSSLRR